MKPKHETRDARRETQFTNTPGMSARELLGADLKYITHYEQTTSHWRMDLGNCIMPLPSRQTTAEQLPDACQCSKSSSSSRTQKELLSYLSIYLVCMKEKMKTKFLGSSNTGAAGFFLSFFVLVHPRGDADHKYYYYYYCWYFGPRNYYFLVLSTAAASAWARFGSESGNGLLVFISRPLSRKPLRSIDH